MTSFLSWFPSLSSLLTALTSFWGIFSDAKYDVIVVGGGAGGCPLVQTLVEEGGIDKKVLLIERGGERLDVDKNTETQSTTVSALSGDCSETLESEDGVILAAGKCMGGGTSINLGVWIEEQPQWIVDNIFSDIVDKPSLEEIDEAHTWLRTRVGTDVRIEKTNATRTYLDGLLDAYQNNGFSIREADDEGRTPASQATINTTHVFRVRTIFRDNGTGVRRSADSILDRSNPKLDIRTRTKVRKILFDGDWRIPRKARVKKTDTPRARCVQLTSFEVICVKPQGRIYLSAGTFHSPEILLKSGVGPNGDILDNDEVGANLIDKIALFFTTNLPRNFEYENEQTAIQVAAPLTYTTSSGKTSFAMFQESSYGFGGSSITGGFLQTLLLLPTSLRTKGLLATPIRLFGTYCADFRVGFDVPIFGAGLCQSLADVLDAGCDSRVAIVAGFVSNPTSRGRVSLGGWLPWSSDLKINVNYLSTPEDVEFLGMLGRSLFNVLTSVTGPTAREKPCDDVDEEEVCDEDTSCPALFKGFYDLLNFATGILFPNSADEYPVSPASTVIPNFVERVLKENEGDVAGAGEALRESISTVWHYAGTNSMGKVVDETFQVYGVEGLYVADASVLPKSSRANSMPITMLMGRLAGLRAAEEYGTTTR